MLIILLGSTTQAAPSGSRDELDLDTLLSQRSDKAGDRLREGLDAIGAGDRPKAVRLLAAVAPDLGDLTDYALVLGAEAALAAGDAPSAVSLLSKVQGGTPLDAKVPGLRGRALAATGDHGAAIPLLSAYLDQHPNGARAAEVRRALAAALSATGKKKAAKVLRREMWAKHPIKLRNVPGPLRPTADEVLSRATRFHKVHRHRKVLNLVEPLLKRKLKPAQRCQALFLAGNTLTKDRKHKRSAKLLTKHVRSRCKEDRVRALFLLGRARARSGQKSGAVKAFDLLVREFPKVSYADDALLLKSEIMRDLGRTKRAAAVLRDQVRRYPDGDMADEARWRLAWMPYKAGKLKASLAALKAAEGKPEKHYYSRGRTLYWKGRVLQRLRRAKAARTAWQECIRSQPLSYYALLAANRLREVGAPPDKQLLPEPKGDTAWRFPHQPAFDTAGFRRAARLLRLGLGRRARGELNALGLLSGESRWLAAVLYERAGMHHRSHNVPRRQIATYQDRPPVGEALREWLVAYPRPFAAELARGAKEGGVPDDLLLALVREESSFNPEIESYANAIGLAQLLLSTAKGVAKGVPGLRATTTTLRQPETNLRLGGRFLGKLLRRFRHPALAVAGYNAGGGAVGKWKRRFSKLKSDEWVESIPYDQTRGYTKRVLQSWGRYHYLATGGEVVSLPLDVPR